MGPELSVGGLLERAERETGLSDWGGQAFLEPLHSLVDALEREGRLDEARRAGAAAGLTGTLIKRLSLIADRRAYPEIAKEEITAPLVILGLPRTGSTHLHGLMALAEGVRAPLQWEMSKPSPPPEAASFHSDPRIEDVQAGLDALSPDIMVRHPFGALRPEQCSGLMDWSFLNMGQLASYWVPSYREYLVNADFTPAYEAHKRTLQHLQWRNPGRWVLKFPKHVFSLDALIAAYPDVRIVWTHRDPGTVLPSVASFVGGYRAADPGYDKRRFGREWTAMEELGLLRGLAVREAEANESRYYDLHYNDLMADPVAAVAGICEFFGLNFSAEDATRIGVWMEENPQTRHGIHRYRAEDFGLSADHLRSRFRPYIERFGVEPDAHRPV